MSPAKGYLPDVAGQVGAWYGSALSGPQVAQAVLWAEAAEALIDTATGRPFLTGAVVGERHTGDGPLVWLYQAPVTSIDAVRGYTRGDTTATTLVVTTDYELDDATRGRLYLPSWRAWASVQVDYTPVATVPALVSEMTAALLADWLQGQATAASGGGALTRLRAGDVEEQYAEPPTSDTASGGALPAPVQQLLAAYQGRLLVV